MVAGIAGPLARDPTKVTDWPWATACRNSSRRYPPPLEPAPWVSESPTGSARHGWPFGGQGL